MFSSFISLTNLENKKHFQSYNVFFFYLSEGHSRLSSPTTERSHFISKDINNSTTTRKTQQRVLIYRSRLVQTCQDRSIQVQLQTGPEAAVSLHHSLNYYEKPGLFKKEKFKEDRKKRKLHCDIPKKQFYNSILKQPFLSSH